MYYDDATVRDHARVYGDAEVWGNDTEIRDYARVYDDAEVSGGAVIAGEWEKRATTVASTQRYTARLKLVVSAVVKGNAEVYGEDAEDGTERASRYLGTQDVYGDARVSGESRDVKIYWRYANVR